MMARSLSRSQLLSNASAKLRLLTADDSSRIMQVCVLAIVINGLEHGYMSNSKRSGINVCLYIVVCLCV